MPPIRSTPRAIPAKSERTHEENQERAYIAASRRSDRSLEARVESAKRASEVHKKRTGRALRVTEEDVQLEEMYEEEDDDLPRRMLMRDLPPHLKTKDEDYNKKLLSYLSYQTITRNVVGSSQYGSYMGLPYARSMPYLQPQNTMRYQPYPNAVPRDMLMPLGQAVQHLKSPPLEGPAQSGLISPPLASPGFAPMPPQSGSNAKASEVKEEETDSPSTETSANSPMPRMRTDFQNLSLRQSPQMTAPQSLSQEMYPGGEASSNGLFTNQFPQEMQQMAFPATPNGSMHPGMMGPNVGSGSGMFGYNVAYDGLKYYQHQALQRMREQQQQRAQQQFAQQQPAPLQPAQQQQHAQQQQQHAPQQQHAQQQPAPQQQTQQRTQSRGRAALNVTLPNMPSSSQPELNSSPTEMAPSHLSNYVQESWGNQEDDMLPAPQSYYDDASFGNAFDDYVTFPTLEGEEET